MSTSDDDVDSSVYEPSDADLSTDEQVLLELGRKYELKTSALAKFVREEKTHRLELMRQRAERIERRKQDKAKEESRQRDSDALLAERQREAEVLLAKEQRDRDALFAKEQRDREALLSKEKLDREDRLAERQERLDKEQQARNDQLRREQERLDREQQARDDQLRKEEERRDDKRRDRAERQKKEDLRIDRVERVRHEEAEALAEALTKKSGEGGGYRVDLKSLGEKDDIDKFFIAFEQIATAHKWDKKVWATRIRPKLTGLADEACSRMSPEDVADFAKLKAAVLEAYHRTPYHYCQQFRNLRKLGNEDFKQFYIRLQRVLDQWMESAECDKTDAEQLYDLFLKEQLLNQFSGELRTFVVEKGKSSAKEAAKYAYEHIEARREGKSTVSMVSVPRTPRPKSAKDSSAKDKPQRKYTEEETKAWAKKKEAAKGSSGGGDSGMICYGCHVKGHRKANCPANQSQASAQYAVHSSPRKDKPSVLSVENALCNVCEAKDPHLVGPAFVNGHEVQYLRDTGADDVCVSPKLVSKKDYTGESKLVELADRNVKRHYPTAMVEIDSPFLRGRVRAIVIPDLYPDVFIGNNAEYESGEWTKVSVYPLRSLLALVVTRAAEKRDKSLHKTIPVVKVDGLDITPEQLRKLQHEDESLQRARQTAESGQALDSRGNSVTFKTSKGILKRGYSSKDGEFTQVCVPKPLRDSVLQIAHDTPMGGHLGAKKTQERVWAAFYWPGMCGDIRRYCQSCPRCQKIAPRGRVKKVPLGRMPLTHIPFHRVAVDLVGPIIPASDGGFRFILVMVDFATRYPEAIPLKNVEATTIAEALFTMWSRLGVPKEVLSDNGGQFTGHVWAEVNRLLAINSFTTTPYHPQCNGLVERFNGTLKCMLRKMCVEDPKTWDRFVPAVLFASREVPQASTGFSPFELLYGRTVRGPMAILRDLWTHERTEGEQRPASAYVFELRNRIQQTCELAQENLETEALRQKKHFDKKAKMRTFKTGDRVLLLLPEKKNKLEMSWQGPYVIEEPVSICDYRVVVRGKTKLFHANLLKLFVERVPAVKAIGIIDESDQWEAVTTTTEDIPLIPLVAEETVDDIHLDPLTPEIHAGVRAIVKRHEAIVTDLPQRTTLAKCGIRLAHNNPIRTRQFPLPYAKREVIGKEVKAMLKMGVIEPSSSPYSSPIVLVAKPDGKMRFCSDYRRVNRVVEFDSEPMPDVQYIMSKLHSAKYLSKIDLTKGYWQIAMEEADKPKTAFTTPQGCFQWTVMPFGLKTAGAVFTRMMRALLNPLDMKLEIDNFIDDILVATVTMDRHLECLEALFARLEEVHLSARPSKCYLGFRQLEYLGFTVGYGELQTEPRKMEKIRDAPRPTTKKQVRGFLGLAGFYRRFVPHFANIALPLTEATKSSQPNEVVWNDDRARAFNELKERLTSPPICVLPDTSKDFVLRTDASGYGLGALLLQDHGDGLKMVECASKKLLPAEQNYSTIERECLAIVWAIKRFHPYLYGREFVLQCDHQPLEYLNSVTPANSRLTKWSLLVQSYAFTIQAIPGVENVGADFLSRNLEP